MIEVDTGQLQQADESQHHRKARPIGYEPVKETFGGKTVWDVLVHIFALEGYPRPIAPTLGRHP